MRRMTTSATITISAELAARGQLARWRFWPHLAHNLGYFAVRFGTLYVLVIIIDEQVPAAHRHLAFAIATGFCSLYFALVARRQWRTETLAGARAHTYRAEFDESGVVITWEASSRRYGWDTYAGWVDEGDALRLTHRDGHVSHVPITDQTQEAVAYTKRMVPPMPAQ